MGYMYLNRDQWGANPQYPPLGYFVPPQARKRVIHHHTVTVDANDASRNLWTNLDEVKAHMRRLQTIRPDLGMDVPYSFVLFCMEDGTLVVCEGRGLTKTGAHTHGFNTEAYGVSWAADTENYPLTVADFVPAVNSFLGWLKEQRPSLVMPNDLHRNHYQTACPGQGVVSQAANFRFEEDDVDEQARADIAKLEKALADLRALLYSQTIPGSIIKLTDVDKAHNAVIEDLAGRVKALEGG